MLIINRPYQDAQNKPTWRDEFGGTHLAHVLERVTIYYYCYSAAALPVGAKIAK